MSEPWLGKWRYKHDPNEGGIVDEDDRYIAPFGIDGRPGEEYMIAAAPEMCRALLAVEWEGTPLERRCAYPTCFSLEYEGHSDICPLDAALTKAGLDTQEKRDAAREKIKEMGL